jgi:hypothetical protein
MWDRGRRGSRRVSVAVLAASCSAWMDIATAMAGFMGRQGVERGIAGAVETPSLEA